jgi:hypothetical protein
MFASSHSLRNIIIMFHATLRQFCRQLCFLSLSLSLAAPVMADKRDDAEAAAQALARDQEKLGGYTFRSEAWVGELSKDVGKAVKMQLFKGHEYCIGVAVPKKSGVRVTGAVLDFQGNPVGEIQPVLDGWGFLLFFKPQKTGIYVTTIRLEEDGKQKDTACAIVTGYK